MHPKQWKYIFKVKNEFIKRQEDKIENSFRICEKSTNDLILMSWIFQMQEKFNGINLST